MKRKILSLILVLMLIPFASLFVACGNNGYNLSNLKKDFLAIANANENVVATEEKHLVFDYSGHARLNGVIQSNYPYTIILDYNEIYNNLMAFTFDYIGVCSNNKAIEDKALKDKVKSDGYFIKHVLSAFIEDYANKDLIMEFVDVGEAKKK